MTVRPVCLPSKRDSRQSFTNIPAVVTGWGVTSDRNPDLNDVLQEANVTTISNNECELQFPTVVQELFHYSYNSFFKLKLILKNFWMNLSQNILLYQTMKLCMKDTNICISGEQGRSTCSGDSGGPLLMKNKGKICIP